MQYVDTLKLTNEDEEVVVTEYTAASNEGSPTVLLSERENEDVATVEILDMNIDVIRKWFNNWHPEISKSEYPKSKHEAEFEVKKTMIKVKLIIEDIVVLQAKWLAHGNKVDFQPRPEVTLTIPDFILFFRNIRKLQDAIREASSGKIS